MEFNEKLQQLRTGKNLTQEQLAEQLYVSRTAISKWESGKGYPNIESLKCISKFFSVTIDELLSGEELITLAETENRSNLKKIYSFIYGILDMMAVTFILLPLYGNLVDGYIYSVNLLSFTDTTPIYLAIYWIVFIVLIALGIAKLMCVCFDGIMEQHNHKMLSRAEYAFYLFAAARHPFNRPYHTEICRLHRCFIKTNETKVKCHKPFKIGSDTISVGAFFVLTSIVSAL